MVARLDQRADRLDRGVQRGTQLDQVVAQRDGAAREARDIEQIVDQPGQVIELAGDDVARLEAVLARGRAVHQQIGGAAHRRQRVAQFVHQHREEIVLAALFLAQHLLGTLLLRDVLAHADHAVELAAGVVDREGARAHVAGLAVGVDQRELEVHMAIAQHRVTGSAHAFAIGLGDPAEAGAAVPMQVFDRTARQRDEGRTDEQELALLRIEDPQHVGQVVGQLAEQELVVAQRLRGPVVGLLGSPQPQQRLDAGDQFLRLDRLHQIAVGTVVQRLDPVARVAGRSRRMQDQRAAALRVVLDDAADVQAVDVRQLHVEQHQVRRIAAHQRQRRLAGRRFQHRIVRSAQDAALDVARALVVVDHQHQRPVVAGIGRRSCFDRTHAVLAIGRRAAWQRGGRSVFAFGAILPPTRFVIITNLALQHL